MLVNQFARAPANKPDTFAKKSLWQLYCSKLVSHIGKGVWVSRRYPKRVTQVSPHWLPWNFEQALLRLCSHSATSCRYLEIHAGVELLSVSGLACCKFQEFWHQKREVVEHASDQESVKKRGLPWKKSQAILKQAHSMGICAF